jgi:Uncharacterized conserved protein
MARATTKEELIEATNNGFEKMWNLINSFTEEQKCGTFDFEDRDKNIRDILIHLYEWHILLINWIENNKKGDTKPFLPEPYNWKTYPEMNVKFWEKHQNTSYEVAEKDLASTHKKVIELINSFTNEELFIKKYFSWTGTTSLGSYCVSATSSHYDWAIKKIKKYQKDLI